MISTCHQNRIIYGRSKLNRTDNDTRHKRKRRIRIKRYCHITCNRKFDDRDQDHRNGNRLKRDQDDNKDRQDGNIIYCLEIDIRYILQIFHHWRLADHHTIILVFFDNLVNLC